ncbi:MAG: PAS domain-containing protein, partial [Terriglobia bacterium]
MDDGLPGSISHPSSLTVDALRERLNAAEKARRFAENRYRLLFERSLAGVYRATLDGRIVDLNESCARMFGYREPDEVQGYTLQETVLAPRDFERLLTLLQTHKSVSNIELELRRQDGQRICALVGASLVENSHDSLIEGTLIDITERKKVEEALRRSEERFRTLVEKSSDAISLVDASGKILYSSHAISPIFGYSLEERVGRNIFELLHPEDTNQV